MLFNVLICALLVSQTAPQESLSERMATESSVEDISPSSESEVQLVAPPKEEAPSETEESSAEEEAQKAATTTNTNSLLDQVKERGPVDPEKTIKQMAVPQMALPGDSSAKREKDLLDKLPGDWYKGTSKLFDYCVEINFQHPICPPIKGNTLSAEETDFFLPPIGGLDYRSLFQARTLYELGRPPMFWIVSLRLDKRKPTPIDPRLWAEAQWLYAQILFDHRKYKESLEYFDRAVPELKMKALFHQQRAWLQLFNGQFDKALGSIVGAESPLVWKVPFFDKYFLRALIERETCNLNDSLNTIIKGRAVLQYATPRPDDHPWVVLCERQKLGETCNQLRAWYTGIFQNKIQGALDDLELLEIELRDKGAAEKGKDATSKIVWPFVGENWKDELGYYSVPIENRCK